MRGAVLLVLAATLPSMPARAADGPQARTTRAAAEPGLTVIVKSQHRRLPFVEDIKRLAVGDTDIVSAEIINSREILVLGRETGRTTLIVWFADGTSREFLIAVQRDLSVLERALKRVDPSIDVESAPDRDAIVLTGTVADISVSQAAEAVARNYLDAASNRRGSAQTVVTMADSPAGTNPPAAGATQTPAAPAPNVQLQGAPQANAQSGTIINLIELRTLPAMPEQKILDAVRGIGGQNISVRRVLHGNVRDDGRDTLVLEGSVPNQIVLVRVLTVAAQVFAGQTITADDIRVIADEAGALASQQQNQSQSSQTQLGGGATSSLFGGARGTRLTNQVRTNLGRAKAIEAAGGRILSFLEVTDLPQVRVDIRLVEVNRTKLRAYNPNTATAQSNFRQPSLNPSQSATTIQGDQAARVGAAGAAIQNVLSFLNGGLLNELQFSGNHFAIDTALSLLEREGIARSLSSPSLTVLSGELAQVQVGGEVPVPTAFAPAFGAAATTASGAAAGGANGTTPGVFSSVEFVPFGVQLQIRPLVGDDDTITLDVQPLVVTPDTVLTDTIRQATGTNVPTTAFQTRALRTSSRLQDGQALVIGGLTSNSTSSNTSATPGLKDAPLIGRLFQGFNHNDQTTELIVVVNPVVVRTPAADAGTWAFPSRDELMKSILGNQKPHVSGGK
jgi:Flp pilus assembly secretin CpaC